jgi:hypothetical protein
MKLQKKTVLGRGLAWMKKEILSILFPPNKLKN